MGMSTFSSPVILSNPLLGYGTGCQEQYLSDVGSGSDLPFLYPVSSPQHLYNKQKRLHVSYVYGMYDLINPEWHRHNRLCIGDWRSQKKTWAVSIAGIKKLKNSKVPQALVKQASPWPSASIREH